MSDLGSFRITTGESRQFARASGDHNPLHLDPVAARRTQFGQTLIHGVAGTLRALDRALAEQIEPAALRYLRVKFPRPVSQGTAIRLCEVPAGTGRRLELFAGDTRCQIIDFDLDAQAAERGPPPNAIADPPETACRELDIGDCEGLAASVDLRLSEPELHSLFPNAVRALPMGQLLSILACTEIVGMRCPGLHSVFATLDLQFPGPADGTTSALDFRVTATDPRINRVVIAVENAFAQGTVEAFFRPPPVHQAAFSEVCERVAAAEFDDQCALVIGASRGLGEVIAKVLAAGGARLMLTYASGADDAERIAQEIAAARDRPGTCRYDVLAPAPDSRFDTFLEGVTHIYYLASPVIRKGEPGNRDEALFERYHRFYVDGLAALLEAVRARRGEEEALDVFVPSSVFLDGDVKGFDEYVEAKRAAEAFAAHYASEHPGTHFAAPRLPRLHTDQTGGVRGLDATDTLEVIVDTLRRRYARSAQPAQD